MSKDADRETIRRSSQPPRPNRRSGTHLKAADAAEPSGARLSEVRRRATSLRRHGWKWEMQGRAWAYREAAQQARKWLLEGAPPPDPARLKFLVDLFEKSADVYEHADEADDSGD